MIEAGSDSIQPYRKATETEVSSSSFDQPLCPGGPRLKYVVCSTQRSGSFLLCRQLINANLGVPHEYYNALHIGTLCNRWGLGVGEGGAAPYLREIYRRRTTSNGVWGTKLQWLQYLESRPMIDDELRTIDRYIFLFRTDVAAQAVSLHLSLVTGIWGFEGIQTTPGRPHIPLDDLEHIAVCARCIQDENTTWLWYFAKRKIVPLTIHYEDYMSDQSGTLARIGSFLGVDPAEYQVPPPEVKSQPFSAEFDTLRRTLLERFRKVEWRRRPAQS